MTGIPKAGRPQEPTGTSRGGIACSTATMQDPGNGSLRQTLLRAHRHQAPSTSASDPARFSRRQGVTAGTFATLLHLIGRRHADAEPLAQGSDGQREFVERDRHPLVHWLLAREVVVPTSQVLHEAMPNDDHPGATVLLEPAHRPQPRLNTPTGARDLAG